MPAFLLRGFCFQPTSPLFLLHDCISTYLDSDRIDLQLSCLGESLRLVEDTCFSRRQCKNVVFATDAVSVHSQLNCYPNRGDTYWNDMDRALLMVTRERGSMDRQWSKELRSIQKGRGTWTAHITLDRACELKILPRWCNAYRKGLTMMSWPRPMCVRCFIQHPPCLYIQNSDLPEYQQNNESFSENTYIRFHPH